MVKAFEKVCGNPVPFKIMSRRLGDVASCFAQVDKAKRLLSWEAEFGLHQMCEDAWRWQQSKS